MIFGVIFFVQAEDGIRDVAVTGVQTCALPISLITFTRLAHVVHARGLRSPATGLTPLHDAPPIPRPPSRRGRSTPFSLGEGSMRTIALASTLFTVATLTGGSDGAPQTPAGGGAHPPFAFPHSPSN